MSTVPNSFSKTCDRNYDEGARCGRELNHPGRCRLFAEDPADKKTSDDVETVVQCRSCPWRVACVPDKDIPRYDRELAKGLTRTIQSGIASMFQKERHVMACHYSKPGEEFACAGWLHNQIGVGNNLGVRIAVMTGHHPVPVIDGDQHESYEDTLPCDVPARTNRRKRPR